MTHTLVDISVCLVYKLDCFEPCRKVEEIND